MAYKRTHLPCAARRALALKYGCKPGKTTPVACYWCEEVGEVIWPLRRDGGPSSWPIFTLTVEHLQPMYLGGTHDESNLEFACRYCNASKGERTVEQFIVYRERAV